MPSFLTRLSTKYHTDLCLINWDWAVTSFSGLQVSYLTERKQRVVINGVTSETVSVVSGVPQGSVLVPLLLLIYVDGDMNLPVSEGSQLVLYADDILLYRPIIVKKTI